MKKSSLSLKIKHSQRWYFAGLGLTLLAGSSVITWMILLKDGQVIVALAWIRFFWSLASFSSFVFWNVSLSNWAVGVEFKSEVDQVQALTAENRELREEIEKIALAATEQIQEQAENYQKITTEIAEDLGKQYQEELERSVAIAYENSALISLGGVGRDNWLSSTIQAFFSRNSGLMLDYFSHTITPGRAIFWYRPRNPETWKDSKKLEELLMVTLGCEALTLTTEKKYVRVELNDVAVDSGAEVVGKGPKFGYIDWDECFRSSCHLVICGPTNAGKSTFVNNAIREAVKHFGADDVEVFIIDPKYPNSEWKYPQYTGFSRIVVNGVEHPDYIDGVKEMYASCRKRYEEAGKAAKTGEPLPEFPLQIWVFDEVPSAVADAQSREQKSVVIKAVEYVARLGRSARICVILIGQDVVATAYGFRYKLTLRNFTMVALGDLALEGAKTQLATTTEKNAFAKAIASRREEADKDPLLKFYAFYRYAGGSGKLSNLPPPTEDFTKIAGLCLGELPPYFAQSLAEVPLEVPGGVPGGVPVPMDGVPGMVPLLEQHPELLARQRFDAELEMGNGLLELCSYLAQATADEELLVQANSAIALNKEPTMSAIIKEIYPESFTKEGGKSARRFGRKQAEIRSALKFAQEGFTL